MKALIFDSGLGSRLGELTADKPKSLVRLLNGEIILSRQLRLLSSCGIRDFVITTGPFPEKVEAQARPFEEKGCSFRFVANPDYAATNAIFSMYCARDYLAGDDFIVLHGDLVFDARTACELVACAAPTAAVVDERCPLPEKDFKARVAGDRIREISVNAFGDDCVALQPLYKVSQRDMAMWLASVCRFVEAGDVGVYAENALNAVFEDIVMTAVPCASGFVAEVDTPEDLASVQTAIRLVDFALQPTLEVSGTEQLTLVDALSAAGLTMKRPLLVSHFPTTNECALFTGFTSNPTLEQACAGVECFRRNGCDGLISIGGGSAMDVAKCVKALLGAGPDGLDGVKDMGYVDIPHLAVPTTAGTGSEATSFAVCYVDGVKKSVAHDCLLPDAVLLDAMFLAGLPDYQKKCCVLDALCQAIESHWSTSSCEESRALSARAISEIASCAPLYIAGDAGAARKALRAANLAGKAINITKTTAAHAMSYKLTMLYGIPHGHAVAMGMPYCWKALIERGDATSQERLAEIAHALGAGADAASGLQAFLAFVEKLDMPLVYDISESDLDTLVGSVNAERLSNYPLALTAADLRNAYLGMMS